MKFIRLPTFWLRSLAKLSLRTCRIESTPKFRILSDRHLEVGQQYSSNTLPASTSFLILAGDIGRLIDYDGYLDFLPGLVPRYKRIFLVLGNHEFYGLDYDSGSGKAHTLVTEKALKVKVFLMHRTSRDDPESNLTILGYSHWSTVRESAHGIVTAKINDLNKIEWWSVEKHNDLHSVEAACLRQQLHQTVQYEYRSNSEGKEAKNRVVLVVLVVTRHAPCAEDPAKPEYIDNTWTSASHG